MGWEKMPSSLESVMAEETGTDKWKLQSFELKKVNLQLEVKKKIVWKAPLAIFVF